MLYLGWLGSYLQHAWLIQSRHKPLWLFDFWLVMSFYASFNDVLSLYMIMAVIALLVGRYQSFASPHFVLNIRRSSRVPTRRWWWAADGGQRQQADNRLGSRLQAGRKRSSRAAQDDSFLGVRSCGASFPAGAWAACGRASLHWLFHFFPFDPIDHAYESRESLWSSVAIRSSPGPPAYDWTETVTLMHNFRSILMHRLILDAKY
jgi:hypothetical protein